MRVLLFSDIHFKLYGSIQSWNRIDDSGITYELKRAVRSMDFVRDQITKHKPDIVVCLGDVFHSLYSVDSPVFVESVKQFSSLYSLCSSMGVPFWLIAGNHDKYSSRIYTTSVLPADLNMTSYYITEYGGASFALVPYGNEADMYQFITSIYNDVDFIFTHMTFDGVFLNDKKVLNNQFDPPDGDLKIISGHIHKHQRLRSVLYVSSLYQQFPSDSPEVGLVILDTETREYEFIRNTYVKSILTVNDENLGIIEDLDPDLYYLRVFVTDDIPNHISTLLEEFEHSIFRRPSTDGRVEFSTFDVESPDVVVRRIIENDYPHLAELCEGLI